MRYRVKRKVKATMASSKESPINPEEHPSRARILDAAFAAFLELGYAQTSTLEIAKRAGVSKRDLYGLVGTKHDMLVGCIERRAGRLRPATELPEPTDLASFATALTTLSAQLLRETLDDTVIGVFRIAIGEATRVPELAHTLDRIGRGAAREALTTMIARGRLLGLFRGRPAVLADQLAGLIWGELTISRLLGVVEQPSAGALMRRARTAVAAFLQLHAGLKPPKPSLPP